MGVGMALLLVALVATVVLVYRRQKNVPAFTNNPILVGNAMNSAFPNYGTFSA